MNENYEDVLVMMLLIKEVRMCKTYSKDFGMEIHMTH
jgi:hypothetical protein